MTENKICKECPYNHYPECYGTKMDGGNYMKIDALKEGFECGQKDEPELFDFSIKRKTEAELKIEELEARLEAVEEKTADLSEIQK